MTTYIVVDVNITDMQGFQEYATKITGLIEKHSGRYIVRGAVPDIIQGQAGNPQYVVVIEFPDHIAADKFIQERDDIGLFDLWKRSTKGRILKVEGCI